MTMKTHENNLLFWTPRIASIILAAFIFLLAMDVFYEPRFWKIHLIESALILSILAVAWRHEWFGGMLFILLGTAFMILKLNHVDLILLISVPLFLIGILLLAGWYQRKESAAKRTHRLG
jgi:hypothetical protein